MNRQDLERELKKYNGGAMSINQSELMKARHKGRAWVKEFCEDMPYWKEGRTIEYPIKEVARKLFEELNRGGDYEG